MILQFKSEAGYVNFYEFWGTHAPEPEKGLFEAGLLTAYLPVMGKALTKQVAREARECSGHQINPA